MPDFSDVAAVYGGAKEYHISSGTTASTNANNIKPTPGIVYSVTLISTSATLGYFRFYDTIVAPTPSSSANAGVSIPVPASTTGAGVTVTFGPTGIQFLNGISFCVTGGGADNDNTDAPSGIYVIIMYN